MELLLIGIIISLIWPPMWFGVAGFILLALYGHKKST